MSKRLLWLQAQREEAVAAVTSITDLAADEGRELTDAEVESCKTRSASVERWDADLQVESALVERNAAADALKARVGPLVRQAPAGPTGGNIVTHVAEPAPMYRTAPEYLVDVFKMRGAPDYGVAPDPAARQRITEYRDQLRRAAPNQLLADTPAIVPVPLVGNIITNIDARRPAWDAATKLAMPAHGSSFERPRAVNHAVADVQATEKTDLVSSPITMDTLTITKQTVGSRANLSFQSEAWTDPALLAILTNEMAAAYAVKTDDLFTTAFVAAVSQSVELVGSAWTGAVSAAAAQVYAAGNSIPTTVWVSPDRWATLASLVDTTGRPLNSAMNPSNAVGAISPGVQGGSLMGFRLVVDATFPSGTMILGDASGVEVYESVGGLVSAVEPSHLGHAVAFYGYIAYKVIRPELFVKITDLV